MGMLAFNCSHTTMCCFCPLSFWGFGHQGGRERMEGEEKGRLGAGDIAEVSSEMTPGKASQARWRAFRKNLHVFIKIDFWPFKKTSTLRGFFMLYSHSTSHMKSISTQNRPHAVPWQTSLINHSNPELQAAPPSQRTSYLSPLLSMISIGHEFYCLH